MSTLPSVRLHSSMTMEQLISSLNENFNLLQNQGRTTVIRDDEGVNRIIIGRQPDASYGIKMSKAGIDVTAATNEQLIFNSNQNVFKIVNTGTVTVNKAANETSANVFVSHGLSYAPMVIAFGSQGGATNYDLLPDITFSITTGAISKHVSTMVTSSDINFYIATPSWTGNTFYTDPLTYKIRYYIIGETAAS